MWSRQGSQLFGAPGTSIFDFFLPAGAINDAKCNCSGRFHGLPMRYTHFPLYYSLPQVQNSVWPWTFISSRLQPEVEVTGHRPSVASIPCGHRVPPGCNLTSAYSSGWLYNKYNGSGKESMICYQQMLKAFLLESEKIRSFTFLSKKIGNFSFLSKVLAQRDG